MDKEKKERENFWLRTAYGLILVQPKVATMTITMKQPWLYDSVNEDEKVFSPQISIKTGVAE